MSIFKTHTVRLGLARKDDSLSDRYFEGAEVSREMIERLLDEYYELRGWDRRTGVPTREKLVELGLGDIARELLTT